MKRVLAVKASIIAVALSFSQTSHADFGEIDLVVRESIDSFFQEIDREVNLNSLSYIGHWKVEKKIIQVRSSVKGEQQLNAPILGQDFVWYDCSTEIELVERGTYRDLGTACDFDID